MWQKCGGGPYTLIPPLRLVPQTWMEVNTKLFATGLVHRKFCPRVITCASNNMEDASTDDEQSDNAWSDDSDDNYENDEEV